MKPDAVSPFVVVAGNIATGKSGLVNRLAEGLQAAPLLETVASNPYFDRFYDDPNRWAFHSQVAFTADSLRRHVRAQSAGAVVQDRTVYETVDVFGAMLHRLGHLSSADLGVLREFAASARALPRQPSMLLFLNAPVESILERIERRGRSAERHLTREYLLNLEEQYEKFLELWSLSRVHRIDTSVRDLRLDTEVDTLLAELDTVESK